MAVKFLQSAESNLSPSMPLMIFRLIIARLTVSTKDILYLIAKENKLY